MNGNLGQNGLRAKRRATDPMAAFDRLPPKLRSWLAEATLPWSPSAALRIWLKCQARGLTPDEALSSLSRAEKATLAREKFKPPH